MDKHDQNFMSKRSDIDKLSMQMGTATCSPDLQKRGMEEKFASSVDNSKKKLNFDKIYKNANKSRQNMQKHNTCNASHKHCVTLGNTDA